MMGDATLVGNKLGNFLKGKLERYLLSWPCLSSQGMVHVKDLSIHLRLLKWLVCLLIAVLLIYWERALAVHYKQMWQAMCCSRQTPPHWSKTFLTFWDMFECLTKTCSDKVYSVPFLSCSNFQSFAMFEGSECVEVDGGSTESTVASSISACKKVKRKTELSLMCLFWDRSVHLPVCPSVCLLYLLYFFLPLSLSVWLCTCPSYLSVP